MAVKTVKASINGQDYTLTMTKLVALIKLLLRLQVSHLTTITTVTTIL